MFFAESNKMVHCRVQVGLALEIEIGINQIRPDLVQQLIEMFRLEHPSRPREGA